MTPYNRYSIVSLLALSLAMPALAQQTPAEPPPAGGSATREREVVVVTANKREESVQDVAVAITAVTSEQRDELGIKSITDLTNLTPGLQYTAGNERITLRGIGRNTNNFGAEPGVANYTDGIYQSFASIAGRDNLFVDRIEVLRGPQGTLYGRNSIGGALNIISKRPTNEFKADAVFGAGNFESRKAGVAVSGPLTDWLRYRAVAFKEVRDEGIFTNVANGQTEGYNVDNYNFEGQLEGDIGDRVSFWAKYTTGSYHNAGPPGGRTTGNSIDAPYNTSFGSLTGTGAVNPGTYWAFSGSPAILSYTQTGNVTQNPALKDPFAINQSRNRFAETPEYNDFALEMVYSFDTFDVKYTGGSIYYNYELRDDQDGGPVTSITYRSTSTGAPSATGPIVRTIFPEQTLFYNENRAFFSNEVNFISTTDSPIQWIAGLYAYQENFSQPVSTYFKNEPLASTPQLLNASYAPITDFSPLTLAPPNPERLASYTNNIGLNNSYGVFGQVDWQFTETLKATVGLRYSIDNKHIQEQARLFCLIQCSFAAGYLPYTDVTRAIWNGVSSAPGIQQGVTGATAANPTGVTYNLQTGNAERLLEDEWDAVTGTAGLEYKPNQDTMLFAKYTRGYKTGGFNATSMSPNPRTKPEVVNSYELGWKQEVPDWNLTANMSAYFYDYQQVQTPLTVVPAVGLSYTAFVNIPKVETTGFEIETTWNPIGNLNLLFNYAFVNPEITDGGGQYANALQWNAAGTALGRPQSLEGNILPQAAKNKFALNASYLFEFENGSTLLPSVSYYWRDKFTGSVFNDPDTFTPDYAQTDARLIWNSANQHFTVIGFVRNAFDEEGYDAATAFRVRAEGPTGKIYHTYTPTLPRTYGVEVQFHY
jgi:iron complex outermembrane receptor protein